MWNNLGNAYRRLSRLDDAETAFARALEARPDYPLAAANLAGVLRDQGEVERAEAVARAALSKGSVAAPFRPLVVLLAGLLRERGALDEAAQLYLQAIQAAPEQSSGEWFHLGWVLAERGQLDRAREAYARARKAKPREPRAALAEKLALPMVYDDVQSVIEARQRFENGVAMLDAEVDAIFTGLSPAQAVDGLRWTNFFLAYQGCDDLALQTAYGNLASRVVETYAAEWRRPLALKRPGRRVRIGFASAFFHVGTVGRYFLSWITDLDRERFEVFVYHLFPGMDEIASAIERRADRFRSFGGSEARPSVVAPAIRGDELDLLVYPELGMDVTSFALAALRLAPRQIAAWGHPVTTGHATIDAFITCEAMEPESCERHYRERLLKLPGMGTRYERPQPPADGDRARFGLPSERPLFLCPQSLFKIHPDNDELLAQVLTASPDALLVLFSGRHPAITDQAMRRLTRTFERHQLSIRERTRVLPQLGHDDYLRVNRICDAMLDTLHWSGGNTSLDALACGLPIVTLPGAFMRGRQSAGMLALLGVGDELVARDRAGYATIASRLAADPAWRRDLRHRIDERQERLFDSAAPIERLHSLLEEEARAQ